MKKPEKDLIRISKRVSGDTGITCYDSEGILGTNIKGRWIKIYEALGGMERIPGSLRYLGSRVHFTHTLRRETGGDALEHCYLTLTCDEMPYSGARQVFTEDEKVLTSLMQIRLMGMDEVMERLRGDSFCMDIGQEVSSEKRRIICMFVEEYKDGSKKSVLNELRKTSLDVCMCIDLVKFSEEEKEAVHLLMEREYGESYYSDGFPDCCHMSQMLVVMDGNAKEHAMEQSKMDFLLSDMYSCCGYIAAPTFRDHKEMFLSALLLGMKHRTCFRNLSVDEAEEIFRKEYGDDQISV